MTKMNLIHCSSKFEGTLEIEAYTRFDGQLKGALKGLPGSELIVGEKGLVEGAISGDTVIVDGFVRGNIVATKKVLISATGRVIGEIRSPNISIDFGGYFDGKCFMESLLPVRQAPQPA